jgi:NAD(P)H-nitrite reductase large subunit
MQDVQYLIVGGGVSGVTAAESIRRLKSDARIVVLSAEGHPLYSRVLLPHLVKGKVPRERVFLRTEAQLTAKRIEMVYGARVIRLDSAAHEVETADGATYRYQKLLLATGGEVLPLGVPGDDLAGIVPLRTIEDADAIIEALSGDVSEGRSAAVVGGGFLGLEFPPFFEKYGYTTHLVIRGPHYWWRILDEEASGLIEQTMREHGVVIHAGTELVSCEGEGHVRAIRLSDGTRVPVSFVGYGVGIAGAPAWVTAAGIAGGTNGIVVDEYLRTNVGDVWAAGDAAYFFDTTVQRAHRLGNWLNAQEHGRYTGEAMVGAVTEPFHHVSAYATQIFGLNISFVGDLSERDGSVWISRGSAAEKKVARFHLRNNMVVGAALFNVMTDRATITTLIKDRISVAGCETQLRETSFDLKELLERSINRQ